MGESSRCDFFQWDDSGSSENTFDNARGYSNHNGSNSRGPASRGDASF